MLAHGNTITNDLKNPRKYLGLPPGPPQKRWPRETVCLDGPSTWGGFVSLDAAYWTQCTRGQHHRITGTRWGGTLTRPGVSVDP